MTAKIRKLLIKVNGQPAGHLTRGETGRGEKRYVFTYLPDAGPEQSVSLTMPVRNESYVLGFLPPIFEMSQPEGFLKDHLVNRFGKILDMDDMGLLFLTGRSRIGHVTAEPPPDNTDPAISAIAGVTLRQERQQAIPAREVLEAGEQGWEALFERLLEAYAVSSGVGGMQPKVLAGVAYTAPRNEQRFTAVTPTHIVKTSNREFPYLALNEALCLEVVRHAGIEVPGYELSENGQVILIERFDLKKDGSRYAVEDGCVLQALPAGDKYNSSMEKLVDSILTFLPDKQHMEAAKTIFALTVINALVRNGDAHLKNFAVIYERAVEAALALPYDITTTQAYASLRNDIPALMMNNTRRWPARKELVRFGKGPCRLRGVTCEEIIENVTGAVSNVGMTIPDVIRSCPGSETVCSAMVSCWNDAIKSLDSKKDGRKQKISTALDEVETALLSRYGNPYANRDEPAGTVRQDSSLNMPGIQASPD